MAFVNKGTQRTMSLSVTKTGNDGSTFVMSPTSNPPYLDFDGKNAFGDYPPITEDEMQKLSDVDFTARVDAWKTHLQTTYATSDPDMWADVSNSFVYTNGVVLRLYWDSAISAMKTTILGGSSNEPIYSKLVDEYGNVIHEFDIYPGSTESTTAYGSTSDLQYIKDNNRFLLISSEFNGKQHIQKYVQVQGDTSYPIPS